MSTKGALSLAQMRKRPRMLIINPEQWHGNVLGHLGKTAAQAPNIDKLVGIEAMSFKAEVCA